MLKATHVLSHVIGHTRITHVTGDTYELGAPDCGCGQARIKLAYGPQYREVTIYHLDCPTTEIGALR